MLLQRFFDQSTLAHPDKEALVCGATRVSYADLARRAMHIAHALSGCGVKRGDRVALFLDNSIEMVASVLAVLRVGAPTGMSSRRRSARASVSAPRTRASPARSA